ncbi:MAG: hypothetical protein A2052_00765 [Deltaproteobacteria bacterium GWA2_54_12]|nr:MAG: hypothetical protein A2052_00765 [Deltaproteobacteria bacterium GWA2_54_12]
MDKFKIEIFERENPLKRFPSFRPLSADEQRVIALKISGKLGIGMQDNLSIIAKAIIQQGIPIKDFNAQDENFTLLQLLSSLNIKPENNVFIDWWFKYGDMDEIAFADLNEYFTEMWFPGPDDIDIFDSTFDWIIHIDHEGYISLIK